MRPEQDCSQESTWWLRWAVTAGVTPGARSIPTARRRTMGSRRLSLARGRGGGTRGLSGQRSAAPANRGRRARPVPCPASGATEGGLVRSSWRLHAAFGCVALAVCSRAAVGQPALSFPWTVGEEWKCVQGNNGAYSHTGSIRFAWDFQPIANPNGEHAVRAAADGTARVRKWATQTRPGGRDGDEPYNGGYGNCVVIEHAGGWATLYGHLSRVEGVGSDGTPVSRGQVIGWMGNTGWSTAPHIHIHLGKATSPLRSKETTFEGAINPTKGQKCRSNNSAGGGAPSVAMGDMRPGENYGSAEQRATASTKIRNAHRTEAGSPRNNGGSEYVHRWGACWIQDFDGAGGGAIILPDNASDKAVWIHGVIWRKYCDLGGPSSPLGYPTSDEFLAAIYSGRQPDWASAGKGTRFRHSNPDYDG
ncbi:MAG: hypothetical protein COZ06_35085, partial [Armatimonadetes bacterium CG_4_10_14_3_um_filter_66_18]